MRVGYWIGACGLILACGGGGGGSGGAIPIGGTIDTDNFVIAAGETRVLTSNLKVHTTNSIRIDGTLQVPAGMSFELTSDKDATIGGKIIGDPAAPPGKRPTGDGSTYGDVNGINVRFSGSVSLRRGDKFYCYATGPGGSLVIARSSFMHAGNGFDSDSTDQPGGAGASVEIGSAAAQTHGVALGHAGATAFDTITIEEGAHVYAGDGGMGASDHRGKQDGDQLRGEASAGGRGGDINIFAKVSIAMNGRLKAGDGGRAGAIAEDFPAAQDGYFYQQQGQTITAISGRGGDGGNCSVLSPATTGTGKKFRGNGAYGGFITVSPGNGGESGHGGDANLYVGRKGADGSGDDDQFLPPIPRVVVQNGGNGGAGILAGHTGGNGGHLVIRQLDGLVDEPCNVQVISSFNGGAGADGCIYPPYRAGAVGGTAFDDVYDMITAEPDYQESLVGGDGGFGNGPAKGGTGPLGNGLDGKPCSEATLVVVLDERTGPFPAGSRIPAAWFVNTHIALPETPVTEDHGCVEYHLHGNPSTVPNVFLIDKRDPDHPESYGPLTDPRKNFCGFGPVRVGTPSFDLPNRETIAKQDCCGPIDTR